MRPASPEIWYEALASESGVVLRTNDPARMRAALMEIRRQLDDPDLNCLDVISSPVNPSEDLWLIKRLKNEAQRKLSASEGDVKPASG